ncbi:unnamed protein product [Calypogeia fissa]
MSHEEDSSLGLKQKSSIVDAKEEWLATRGTMMLNTYMSILSPNTPIMPAKSSDVLCRGMYGPPIGTGDQYSPSAERTPTSMLKYSRARKGKGKLTLCPAAVKCEPTVFAGSKAKEIVVFSLAK